MTLERIEITPFVVIVGDLVLGRRTGTLTVVRGALRRVLYWSQGELVMATSTAPEESLPGFLVKRGSMSPEDGTAMYRYDPVEAAGRFHESGALSLSARQSLLREWLLSLTLPLFSLDEGTCAFTDEPALDPDKRIFLQSTGALLIEGIRTITNGLVLRRSLGDMKREIAPARDSRFSLDAVPLDDQERRIAAALDETMAIDTFLRKFPTESGNAARVVIGMLALGIFEIVTFKSATVAVASADDMQRDMEMLAAIGSSDQRSLRAIGLSRQMASMDHYQFLGLARAASRAQILLEGDAMRKRYDPATYPPAAREPLQAILKRIDEAVGQLKDPARRPAYDTMLSEGKSHLSISGREVTLDQRVNQRVIAEQNYSRARELSVTGDYYGAIVLLKQAVNFIPDFADAWYLLGSCQERNPKWRREAAESFQRALAIDPNRVDPLLSLGDLYKLEGLTGRAQSCYEDALKVAPDNAQAKKRLQDLKVGKKGFFE